jgi:hypothetical protein
MQRLKIVSASLACAFVLGVSSTALAQASQTGMTAMASSATAATLKQDMRKLWTDHVVWTRDYIIAALGDHPGAQASANRLLRNQEDIGSAVAKFYGDAPGKQLTTLLKEHITIAVDVVKAAKAGDKAGLQKADGRWQQNGEQIADFLSKANPHWPRATLAEMMKMHLSTTTNEVVARLNKDWEGDIRAYDAVYDHILKMSDALSDGIVKQFPDKFGAGTSTRR